MCSFSAVLSAAPFPVCNFAQTEPSPSVKWKTLTHVETSFRSENCCLVRFKMLKTAFLDKPIKIWKSMRCLHLVGPANCKFSKKVITNCWIVKSNIYFVVKMLDVEMVSNRSQLPIGWQWSIDAVWLLWCQTYVFTWYQGIVRGIPKLTFRSHSIFANPSFTIPL